jgi:hypothetical protein
MRWTLPISATGDVGPPGHRVSPAAEGCIVFRPMCDDQQQSDHRPPPRLRAFRLGSARPYLMLPDDVGDPSDRGRTDDDLEP